MLLRDNLIYNLIAYFISYPNEKISNNCFIKEYNQYPYRLEQNLSNTEKAYT